MLDSLDNHQEPDTSTRNHRGYRGEVEGLHPADNRVPDHGRALSCHLAGKDLVGNPQKDYAILCFGKGETANIRMKSMVSS